MDERLTGVVAHRPYPLPDAPWIMQQTWVDLLFAHGRVSRAELRPRIPAELEVVPTPFTTETTEHTE